MTTIKTADQSNISLLYNLYHHMGKSDEGYFENAFAQRTEIYIAFQDKDACGFCLLNRTPRYSLYRKMNIPEIQDLNVVPEYQRRGVGRTLIKHCETVASHEGYEFIGISVGLTKDFGPAQILYTKLGYVPDGYGVTYDRHGVTKGEICRMDDDLALMLVKPL